MKNIKWNYMMSNLILSIEDRGGARSTSFSGRREGREEGIKEGRINTLSNIAKSLKSKNKSDKEIAELLNITINELKKILK